MMRFLSLFLLAAALTSCAPAADPAAETRTVYLVRHAEKCTEPADDPALTPYGQERAWSLARVLKDVPVEAIYSTPLRRTLDTVEPLAAAIGISVTETPIREGFMEALADSILASRHARILVSGHSNTTARMANLLAGTDFPDLDESEYDRLFVVHLGGVPTVDVLRYGAISGSPESCF